MRKIWSFLTDRTTLKTISWRFIALATTFSVVWATTGSITIAGEIGGIDAFLKTIFYWFHEKAWHASDNVKD